MKNASKTSTRRLSVDLREEKHRFLKTTVASKGVSITELIDWVTEPEVLTQLIEMMLKREEHAKAS